MFVFVEYSFIQERRHLMASEASGIVAKNVAFYDTTFMELPAGLHGRQQFA